LRVSAPQLLGQTTVLPILLGFVKRHPAVSLDFDANDRPVDMVGERVDIAVRITSQPPPAFVARRVGTISRVLCAAPAYLRARGVPRKAADLRAHACLLLTGRVAFDLWQLGADGRGSAIESLRIEPRLRLSNSVLLHEA